MLDGDGYMVVGDWAESGSRTPFLRDPAPAMVDQPTRERSMALTPQRELRRWILAVLLDEPSGERVELAFWRSWGSGLVRGSRLRIGTHRRLGRSRRTGRTGPAMSALQW